MIFSDAEVDAAWEKALGDWGLVLIARPVQDPKSEALAFINLETRQVVINPERIDALKARSSLEGIFAHELGHHLRYPGSLAVQARLELLEREILPIKQYSLLNLFGDFLINTDLPTMHPHLQAQLAAVYAGCPATADGVDQDPSFYFFLTCFEEAWMLPPRTLTREAGTALERRYPGARAEAQVLAQELPNLAPNLFTQFLYFASVFSRYQLTDLDDNWNAKKQHGSMNPTAHDHSDPTPGDYADALRRSAQESDAIRKAIERGWLKPAQIPDAKESEARRAGALPGVLAGAPKKLAEAMAIHYRRMAERYLFRPPKEKKGGDAIIPTTLSPWEIGDNPKEIDWLSTVSLGGEELGIANPLKRDYDTDEPAETPKEFTRRLEVYLDVSGSMPDPKLNVNPMTLGAQVLAMSALRAGGQVRALIYSTNNLKHWEWTRSEMEMSRFLMEYIGGGTDFPFAVLKESVEKCGTNQPVRVVLTDSDFRWNLNQRKDSAQIARAAVAKGPFIAMLNGARSATDAWVAEIAALGIHCIPVPDMASFPKVAASLGETLFGDDSARGATRRKAG
ncbi:MAG TPA: hypothetical protein VMV18_09640 [bacterium]|nr:hypothetical protein [bacterium]